MRHVTGLLAPIVLFTACATSAAPPDEREPQPTRVRTALAGLSIDNRTTRQLRIFYRLTRPPATETGVGTVEAQSRAEMAPVPAGEPLVLIARTAAGMEYVLPPRTLRLDEHWVWTIPAGVRFSPPDTVR
jgi:hypothetical protein